MMRTPKKKQVIYILLGPGLLLLSCSIITNFEAKLSATSTLEVTSTIISAPLLPAPSPLIILTPPLTSTVSSSSTPTVLASQPAFQIPVMSEAQPGNPFGQMLGEQGVSYITVTSVEAVRDFYQETLTAQGWEWLYTDMGQGLILGDLSSVLAQEFKQSEHRLAILALASPFQDPAKSPSVLVIADLDTSAGELLFDFLSLMSPVYNSTGRVKEEAIQPDTMQFSSKYLQFNHPSDWFPTRVQMITFPTDIGENNTNIIQRRCANDHETCFINFMLLTGAVYPIPVSLRIYPLQTETTLEDVDTQRWTELTNPAADPLAQPETIEWPEDLSEPQALEVIEVNSITLQDGTPALQRIYYWRQVKLSTPLVGSYTLFRRGDTVIELHTDFTEEEWAALGSVVQETILRIEIVP